MIFVSFSFYLLKNVSFFNPSLLVPLAYTTPLSHLTPYYSTLTPLQTFYLLFLSFPFSFNFYSFIASFTLSLFSISPFLLSKQPYNLFLPLKSHLLSTACLLPSNHSFIPSDFLPLRFYPFTISS